MQEQSNLSGLCELISAIISADFCNNRNSPAWQGGCDGSRTKIGGQCLESSTLYYVIGSLSFLIAVLLLVFGIKMQREAHSKSQSSSEWTIQVPRASQKFSRFEPSWISRPLCNTVDAER